MRNKSPVAIKKIPNARLGFLVLLGFGLLMLAKMPNVRMSRRPRLRALEKTSGSGGSIRWFAGKQLAANRNEPSNGRSVRSTVARRPGRDGRRYIAQLRANKPAAYPHVCRRRLPANSDIGTKGVHAVVHG